MYSWTRHGIPARPTGVRAASAAGLALPVAKQTVTPALIAACTEVRLHCAVDVEHDQHQLQIWATHLLVIHFKTASLLHLDLWPAADLQWVTSSERLAN